MPFIDAVHAVVLGMQVSASLACIATCASLLLTGRGDPAVYLPVLAGVAAYWMPSPARVTYVCAHVTDADDACSASDSVDEEAEEEEDPEDPEEEDPEEDAEEEFEDEDEDGVEHSASSVDTPDLIRFDDDNQGGAQERVRERVQERVPLLRYHDDSTGASRLEDVD